MAPDPPAYPIDESLPDNYDAAIAVPNSDDSDNEPEEQQGYDGYTLLGQHELIAGPGDNNDDSENELDGSVTVDVQNDAQQGESVPAPLPEAGTEEVAVLWNTAPSELPLNSIAMDDERSAQIKAAMAGFSLPASAVPAWASNIPEELWKERLLGRLQQKPDKLETKM